MIYRSIVQTLEKYSFVTRVETLPDFYIKIYYKVDGVEKSKSISRRATMDQLQDLIIKIKQVADQPPPADIRDEMPIEVV